VRELRRRGREAAAAAVFSENTQIRICETSDGEVSYVRYIHEDEVDDPDEGGYYDDWYEHPYYDAGYDGYGYGYGYDDFYDYDYGYDYDYDYDYDYGYGYGYGYGYDYDYGYENPMERVMGRRDRDGEREWEKEREKEREQERERQQAEQEEAEVLEYRRKMKQLARDQRQAAANREWLIRNYGS
jgi:hypothetical protein